MTEWIAALSGSRRDAAIAAALHVAGLIGDGARIAEANLAALAQTRLPRAIRWQPHSVAQGDAGLALVCGYLDRCFPEDGWDATAHRLLASAVSSVGGETPDPGVFSGLAGLGFVAFQLGRGGTRYHRFSTSVEAELIPRTHDLAQTVGERDGLATAEFDVISGLSGIGGYLLAHRANPAMGTALKHTLQALVHLAGDRVATTTRWVTPPELIADPATAERFPGGSFNCGLAHGAPGPLALLALALRAGAPVAGLRPATAVLADWLVEHRCDDRWGINWPAMITAPPAGAAGYDGPSRAAWCYGAPGVARALWLAGSALGDARLQTVAVEAMAAVYRRPIPVRRIDSPTFCHGIAGLLQVTLRFLHDTRLPMFAAAAGDLTDQILGAFEPESSLLGFRDLEVTGARIDQAGLLDGAPGVALALLAASMPVEPTWDRLFLLS